MSTDVEKAQQLLSAVENGEVEQLRKMVATIDWPSLISRGNIWTQVGDPFDDGCNQPSGDRPLHRACRYGETDMASFLLDHFDRLFVAHQLNNRGETPIGIAAYQGHFNVVKLFLDKFPDIVECKDKDGDTALNSASAGGHLNLVIFLVMEKRANVESRGWENLTPLLRAVVKGHFPVVEWLVENGGANLEAKDKQGRSASHLAVLYGHGDILAYLLSKRKSVLLDATDNDIRTPLSLAIAENRLDFVEFLANVGANLETKDKLGRTAFLQAVLCGHPPILQRLIELGADANTFDGEGRKASHLAVVSSNKFVLDLLLSLKPTLIEARNSRNNNTALNEAVLIGDFDLVRFLVVEKKAKLENQGQQSLTPLMMATSLGHSNIADWLAKRGAKDPFLRPPKYESFDVAATPSSLIQAALRGDLKMVRFLVLEKGVDVDARSEPLARTPLLAAAQEGHINVVEFLLEKRANIEARSDESDKKSMAVHLAAYYGHKAVLAKLLERRPDLTEAKTAINDTALNLAAFRGHLPVVQYLALEMKANLENRGIERSTPLLQAVEGGHLQVIEWLLKNGADLDAKDDTNEHNRAIHLAAYYGHPHIIEFLLDRSSNESQMMIDMRNAIGETPLQIARARKQFDAIQVLLLRGALSKKRIA